VRTFRPLLLLASIAAAGTAGTLIVGIVAGMPGGELGRLALLILPAVLASFVAVTAARPLLARSSVSVRMVSVAAVAAVVALVNLLVLAAQMSVTPQDATTIGVLFLYSLGAGIAAALVLARATTSSVSRLAEAAKALGGGDLEARVGPMTGAPELTTLASTLDQMAAELQEAMRRVRDVEARRRDLVMAVSHDLRTPLCSLRAMVEAIDEGVVEDPLSLRRYVGEMRSSVDSLVDLTDDLFELVQLEDGAIEVETERAHLGDVVHFAMAACRSQATTKGLVVETRLNGAASTSCSPRLVRVLHNLLQNAIRHTPSDGSVLIEARREPGLLEVAVEDTGEGLAPDELARVFEPFYRVDPARAGAGSGLGLALAQRIVEGLGGRIEARSRPLAGSRFLIRIPVEL
jgi:signal transduction histidine kinase